MATKKKKTSKKSVKKKKKKKQVQHEPKLVCKQPAIPHVYPGPNDGYSESYPYVGDRGLIHYSPYPSGPPMFVVWNRGGATGD